jgi:hypothetical protein
MKAEKNLEEADKSQRQIILTMATLAETVLYGRLKGGHGELGIRPCLSRVTKYQE